MNRTISLVIITTVLCVFAGTLSYFICNIPSYDDYAATLIFIKNHYYQNPDTAEKIRALLIPHGEHYILLSRGSAALFYTIFGTINFSALVWYQNIYLLAIFVLILFIIKNQRISYFPVLVPITLFLFNLSHWQVALYYWGGIQYYAVFFFSFLSLFLLHISVTKPSHFYFFGALFFAAIALVSFGNGILVLPLGFFFLAVKNKRSYLTVWTLFSLLGVIFFLSGFHGSFSNKPPFNPFWMAKLLFTFLGSFLYVNPAAQFWSHANIVLCFVAGLGVFGFWLMLLFKGYAFKNPFLYCLLSLPILTGILIAMARYDSKAAGGIAPRYMFFSACLPIFLLLIFQDIKKTKFPVILPTLSLIMLLWMLSFVNNWRDIQRNNREISQTLEQWLENPATPLVYYNPDPRYAEALQWALEHGVYSYSPAGQPSGTIRLSQSPP
ncbi:hypothetical protein [Arundinibacter roseus]|uniref:Glycosyltransferase RgtA/B/C/D-like domain-containing protein n=1 Tax=Arundinibacter roseus TaxID=2070510 RepID=A0A4R4KKY2_9BACT|nr:hypothetical protein [Arundinibacter roseus]TDB68960.1 hypothetical protein EZE20_01070 [Arundinibacter roseus]